MNDSKSKIKKRDDKNYVDRSTRQKSQEESKSYGSKYIEKKSNKYLLI